MRRHNPKRRCRRLREQCPWLQRDSGDCRKGEADEAGRYTVNQYRASTQPNGLSDIEGKSRDLILYFVYASYA